MFLRFWKTLWAEIQTHPKRTKMHFKMQLQELAQKWGGCFLQQMSRKCLGNVSEMSRKCPGNVSEMSRERQGQKNEKKKRKNMKNGSPSRDSSKRSQNATQTHPKRTTTQGGPFWTDRTDRRDGQRLLPYKS